MIRDVKAPVYRAEQNLRAVFDRSGEAPTIETHGSTVVLPVERRFGDIAGVQRYVDAVLSLNWVQDKYPRARSPVKVRARRGSKFAHYSAGVIAVPIEARASRESWALREVVVLHELAHHLAGASHGHDATFIKAFLFLVTNLISDEAGWLLSTFLHDEDVRL